LELGDRPSRGRHDHHLCATTQLKWPDKGPELTAFLL
jgi:hypothetical protein